MLTILVVSDATGETAERIVRSALVQFKNAPAEVVRRGHVRTLTQVRAVAREAAERRALILHTLVSNKLRRSMLAESRRRGVDAMDLMGPVLDRLASHLQLTPREKPGLFKQLKEYKSREIEAVEFAFQHDDGQHPQGLKRAEVVLVGISRTMKTPTTLYLAYRRWFAANVPLIPEVQPPAELLAVPAERVFCLFMSPLRLQELRSTRADIFGIPAEPYTSLERIREELRFARDLCDQRGWQQIDATGKSVEEVVREILALLPNEEPGRGPAW